MVILPLSSSHDVSLQFSLRMPINSFVLSICSFKISICYKYKRLHKKGGSKRDGSRFRRSDEVGFGFRRCLGAIDYSSSKYPINQKISLKTKKMDKNKKRNVVIAIGLLLNIRDRRVKLSHSYSQIQSFHSNPHDHIFRLCHIPSTLDN